ncbi:hypothetical protein GALL_524970 [mine drainage metagenome]|uniref:Uncharacterized protein n=1 Tax=mine drainage metagenome TaxID=410659 RepID=A0A1J5PKX3_9ZZZZ
MGDVNRRVAVFVVEPSDFKAHLFAQVGVEVGERLVKQQGFRLDDERARQRDALLLSARQFAGVTLRQDFEFCRGKDRRELFRNGVAIHFPQTQPVDDVLGDRHVRPQRVALEDHRHLALLGRQGARGRGYQPVADMDFAIAGLEKAGDQPQRRGLAAARGA